MSSVWDGSLFFVITFFGSFLGSMLSRPIIRKMCLTIVKKELETAFTIHRETMHQQQVTRPGTIHLHDEGPFTI